MAVVVYFTVADYAVHASGLHSRYAPLAYAAAAVATALIGASRVAAGARFPSQVCCCRCC